jgi:hypothetical protein
VVFPQFKGIQGESPFFCALPLAKSFQEHNERNGGTGAPAATGASEGEVAPVAR